MRIKSIHEGATVRLARTGDILKVGDEVSGADAIRVQGGPSWPAHAVMFEDETSSGAPIEMGMGRIGDGAGTRGVIIG